MATVEGITMEAMLLVPSQDGRRFEAITQFRFSPTEDGNVLRELDHVRIENGVVTGAYTTTSVVGDETGSEVITKLPQLLGNTVELVAPEPGSAAAQRRNSLVILTPIEAAA